MGLRALAVSPMVFTILVDLKKIDTKKNHHFLNALCVRVPLLQNIINMKKDSLTQSLQKKI